jgi:hypothetical protein
MGRWSEVPFLVFLLNGRGRPVGVATLAACRWPMTPASETGSSRAYGAKATRQESSSRLRRCIGSDAGSCVMFAAA